MRLIETLAHDLRIPAIVPQMPEGRQLEQPLQVPIGLHERHNDQAVALSGRRDPADFRAAIRLAAHGRGQRAPVRERVLVLEQQARRAQAPQRREQRLQVARPRLRPLQVDVHQPLQSRQVVQLVLGAANSVRQLGGAPLEEPLMLRAFGTGWKSSDRVNGAAQATKYAADCGA